MKEPHVKSDLTYHFVWCTKYRAKLLTEQIRPQCRNLILNACKRYRLLNPHGKVAVDHVHLVIQCPASLSPSEIMNKVKGSVSHELLALHPELTAAQPKHNLWARGFYVASDGRVDPKIIENYLSEHEGTEIVEEETYDQVLFQSGNEGA